MELSGTNEQVEPRRVRGIVRSFCEYFPAFRESDFAGITPWVGLRPCAPDGLPYLGRTTRCRNLVIATGHAMMGLSLAPISGKLVAELVTGEPPSIDLGLLAPDRY
jgi:D-amino-acid dehydrogenase